MKRTIIATAVLSGIFMSTVAFAADDNTDMGELRINGEIVGTSCTFDGERNATIELSKVGVDRFASLTAGQIYSGYTSPEVTLNVKCSDKEHPRISFNPSQFVNNNFTKNTAGDNGAGFAVYLNGRQVTPESDGTFALTTADGQDGNYKMTFFARYAAVANQVKAGSVESVLTMTVLTD